MTGSLIDMFPPEAQTLLGGVAAVSAVAGLFLWGAGIKVARILVALALGVSAAGLAAWGLPGVTGIAPLTAAIIGFVAGVLAGAVTFRFVQGALLAGCLALAVMGAYFHVESKKAVVGGSRGVVATMAAPEMLIAVPRLPATPGEVKRGEWDAARLAGAAQAATGAVGQWTRMRWEAMPATHRERMAALAGITALAGLLLALWFPRHTTWILTAAAGTVLLVVAAMALLQVYAPQYWSLMPTRPAVVYGGLAVVMGVGMLMQRVIFWPGKKKAKAVAVAAVPVG